MASTAQQQRGPRDHSVEGAVSASSDLTAMLNDTEGDSGDADDGGSD